MGRVLPGTTRTYNGDATVDWPLGATYDVEVVMGLPDDTGAMGDPVFREAFQVDGDTGARGRRPRPSARTWTVGRPSRRPCVNGGSLGIVPLVGFEVFDEAGARVGAAPASEQPLAWPESSVDAAVDLADVLPPGEYTLVVTVLFGIDSLVETRLPFTIGGDPLTAAPPCSGVTPTSSLAP